MLDEACIGHCKAVKPLKFLNWTLSILGLNILSDVS